MSYQTDRPFVSIIVPVLNEEKIIARFLEVFLKQSYSNFEIIVVDGQSTDKTVLIVRDFMKKDVRVKLAFEDPPMGVGNARNIGLRLAQGEIIKFEDADWIETDPTFLSEFVKGFQDPDVMVVARKRRMKFDDLTRFEQLFSIFNLSMRSYPKWALPGYYMAYRTAFARKVGDFEPNSFWGEDKDFLRRVLNLKPKMFMGEPFFSASDIHFFGDFPKRYRSYGKNFLRYEKSHLSKLTFFHLGASSFCVLIPILLIIGVILPSIKFFGLLTLLFLLAGVYAMAVIKLRKSKIPKSVGLLAFFLPFLVLLEGWSFMFGLIESKLKK